MRQKVFIGLVIGLIFVLYGSFLTHKINLVTADLGRHITNGEYLFEDSKVLTTNFYSYTMPDYPDVNHHWGSGLIFYLLDSIGGITLVHLFFIALSLVSFGIYFYLAKKQSSLAWASLAAIPMIFLLAERTEIRPEVFSYFFAGLFLLILYKFREGGNYKWLFLLPVIEILWANTHIYFALGPLIVGAFLTEALLINRSAIKKFLIILLLTSAATLVNPFGVSGALAPFTILQDFGYNLAENQTVLFMLKLSGDPVLRIYIWVFVLVLLSFIILLFKKLTRSTSPPTLPTPGEGVVLANIFLFAGFSFLAWYQIRNITFFGFMALPILAANLKAIFGEVREIRILKAALAMLAVVLVIGASGNLFHRFPYWQEFGAGMEKGNSDGANFFRQNKIQGPVFNNYDIGGYLIYHLYPAERVFVDNRPEAYSVDFFQKLYIPMQYNDEVWREQLAKYNFQSIVFSRWDATPWGQNFLQARRADSAWKTVYLDQYVIIMVRNSPR